jgi:N-acyl-D-aspartate/D-glutamate deacylase
VVRNAGIMAGWIAIILKNEIAGMVIIDDKDHVVAPGFNDDN